MGEVSKDLLRERIKNKRASEGLADIPQEELFAKKCKQDLSYEEREKIKERRTRNKEAAEKSRKKKKQEFELLQSENDQLNQDKCELAAMIEALKKQNVTYRIQLDSLKRWIAKRADTLGLQKKENSPPAESPSKSDVLRGDPSLHSTENSLAENLLTAAERSSTSSPSSVRTSKAGSPSPPPTLTDDFQAVVIKTTPLAPQQHHELAAPWQVENPPVSSITAQVSVPVQAEKKKAEENKTVTIVKSSAQPLLTAKMVLDPIQARPVQMISEEQPMVYMPNPVNPVFVMQGEGGQQVLMPAPQMAPMQFLYGPTSMAGFPQIAMPAQPQVFLAAEAPKAHEVEVISSANSINQSTMSVIGGGNVASGVTVVAADKAKDTTVTQSNAAAEIAISEEKYTIMRRDPSVETAIDSLLKLGYKIELPGDKQNAAASAATALQETEEESESMTDDQNDLQAPLVINIPMDDPQSFPTVTVSTMSSDTMNKRMKRNELITMPSIVSA